MLEGQDELSQVTHVKTMKREQKSDKGSLLFSC